jgi:hypothetical protein
MLTAPAPLPVPTSRTAELWRAIEQGANEACILRSEGQEAAAIKVLQTTLPPLIAEWSRACGQETEACRQALRELFARVQQQVSTAAICRRMVLRAFVPPPGRGRVAASEPVQLRRRVPIGDIGGMLDALEENERMTAFRHQYFPSSVGAPVAALAAG